MRDKERGRVEKKREGRWRGKTKREERRREV